jgi:hypothetical protein
LIRNPENRRKTGYRIKCSMTEGNHVIADLIRNPENRRKTGYRIGWAFRLRRDKSNMDMRNIQGCG